MGGVITSAGAKRPLSDSKKMASRSTKSLHYTGLAFDMALDSGMNNPRKERFVIEEVGDRDWNVWCKTTNEDIDIVKVDGYTYNNTKVTVEDRMFSFTDIAKKYGFHPIKSRRSFKNGGSYLGAEWWHFQYEKALEPGVSTFGGELLKMYTMKECRNFGPWDKVKTLCLARKLVVRDMDIWRYGRLRILVIFRAPSISLAGFLGLIGFVLCRKEH